MRGTTPYVEPPDTTDNDTATFYCEDCKIDFQILGTIVGPREDPEFIPASGDDALYVFCPNDKASDDYEHPTHEISLEGGR